jgi:hypothetical protein
MTYSVVSFCYLYQKGIREDRNMEPIVLLGLIIVVYCGYVALLDLPGDLSARIPRRVAGIAEMWGRKGAGMKPPVKKMAGMHV